jgi:ABC-type sugar transport system permease subunit
MGAQVDSRKSRGPLLRGRLGRRVIEHLTAYFFLFPALLIIFTFGLFPIAFAFFVSLHRWRRFPEAYTGLDNYVEALGNFAYILFFWLAFGAVAYAAYTLWRAWQANCKSPRAWLSLLPGLANAAAIVLFLNWFFKLLPAILDVPRRIPRSETRNRSVFIREFLNSFSFPGVTKAADLMLLGIGIALVLSLVFMVMIRIKHADWTLVRVSVAMLSLLAAGYTVNLTLKQINAAFAAARANGESLPIWSQTLIISVGAALLFAAYFLWQRAQHSLSDRRFLLLSGAAIVLMVGGFLLVMEIPRAFSAMDPHLRQAFWVTVMYVIGTVPIQLGLGLMLAYLLFYNRTGKSFFRVVYFLPYITPFAATAVVFTTIFSNKPDSPANHLLNLIGVPAQKWLLEPTPINVLVFGKSVPGWLQGPGLALVVIMIWNTWTYVGYDTVIFLAGLGGVPSELYEAARMDGANGWNVFRHITLPLLSPTTFFLSLIAIIGTFQAFTQIWIMRNPATFDSVDTVGVRIFAIINQATPEYGYGAAMAIVLFGVILIITVIQNRFFGRRVFYG